MEADVAAESEKPLATSLDVSAVRERFSSLARAEGGSPVVFADAPGGTQAPDSVIEAVADYLRTSNANLGGAFSTSRSSEEVVEEARQSAADLLGSNPDEVVFGPNMTTLAFHLSRSIGRTLTRGDEVVVTVLDHDANFTPWVRAAADAGAKIRWVDIRTEDCTLDLATLYPALTDRTRLVAFTMASNAVGTITAAQEIADRVHEAGALAVVDAVHFAPHGVIDVAALGADVLFASPYKVFGPHLGLAFGRRELLESWDPYKVRPAPEIVPDRWETGTMNHEGLAGFRAAVDYLAGLGSDFGGANPGASRRERVVAGMGSIRLHEGALSRLFLERISEIPEITLFGISEPARWEERTPTFALRLGDRPPRGVAEELARRGIFVWDGNYYALSLMRRLRLEETGGAVRVGFCHYNTPDEVGRVADELGAITRG